MNIYKRQMERLGFDIYEYAKLLGIPVFLCRKLISNEKYVDSNIGINNFVLENVIKKYEEIEKAHPIETKIEIREANEELLQWYNEEYDKEKLFEITKTKGYSDFSRKYNLICKNAPIGWWLGTIVVGQNKNLLPRISKNALLEIASQLKEIIDGNLDKYKYTDFIEKTKQEKKEKEKENNDLIQWYENFDFKKFLKEHKMSKTDFISNCGVAHSSFYALNKTEKKGKIALTNIQKIKDYVESFDTVSVEEFVDYITPDDYEDSILEDTEEEVNFVEIQEENKNNENITVELLKELLKHKLTEEEKGLIRIFGGKI